MPFSLFCLEYSVLYPFSFCTSILHIILHGYFSSDFLCILYCRVHILLGFVDYTLVGGLILLFMYHRLCVYFIILVMYVHMVFVYFPSFYILYAYFFAHITPSFTFYQLCEIYPQLHENFWGVYAYVVHHMQPYVYFEIYLHNINYHI